MQSRVGERVKRGSGWSALSSSARRNEDQAGRKVSYVDAKGSTRAPDLASDYPDLLSKSGKSNDR